MPFVCPQCTADALKIVASIELAPDSRSDEIMVQITRCSRCSFTGLALYEESRRGALDTESVSHRGYYVKKATLVSLRKLIARCPDPHNPRCHCEAHRTLGSVNASGRWNGLDNILDTSTFDLQSK